MTIGEFNLLVFSLLSLSNENAAVIFFVAREFSLNFNFNISISPKCFRSGFREKNALGN